MQASMETNYEDFEPFCKWKRDQNSDTLEVHLPGFKRQQLKVQISSAGMLIITGERPMDDDKSKRISRFKKEFPVSDDYQPSQMHAKFYNGILYLIIPKQIPTISADAAPAGATDQNAKASTSTSTSLTNLNTRIASEIMILAICLAIVGAYVNKYCHCSSFKLFN